MFETSWRGIFGQVNKLKAKTLILVYIFCDHYQFVQYILVIVNLVYIILTCSNLVHIDNLLTKIDCELKIIWIKLTTSKIIIGTKLIVTAKCKNQNNILV